MADYKVIDAEQLDADLTTVADAIRSKGGTTEQLLFPSGMVNAIGSIQSGGGGGSELSTPQLLCTLATEMNIKSIIQANPITTRYAKSFIFFKITGDNVATSGIRTIGWLLVYIDNNNRYNSMIVHTYINSLKSPNSLSIFNTITGLNSSYIGLENGVINNINAMSTDSFVASGNSIYYLEIPFNYDTLIMDTTERK